MRSCCILGVSHRPEHVVCETEQAAGFEVLTEILEPSCSATPLRGVMEV